MNTDFLDAHERHWEDAILLDSQPAPDRDKRLASADQLLGFSAECGLKRIMKYFGMQQDASGRPAIREHRVHINELWDNYSTYLSGRPNATNYCITKTNPFVDWDASQRYANRAEFNEIIILRHKTGAESVRQLINKAIKDGIL
jgi:hypothetical protein